MQSNTNSKSNYNFWKKKKQDFSDSEIMNLYSFENDWLEICQLTHKAVTQLENAHMLNLDLIFHKKKIMRVAREMT